MNGFSYRLRRQCASDKQSRFIGRVEIILVILVFSVCFAGACIFPSSECPDEAARLPITDYIVTNARLPVGSEQGIFMDAWQFSYAYFPYLSSIIGAVFAKVFCFIFPQSRVFLLGARMCSVLSITGCCCFCLLLGSELFTKKSSAILFTVIVCFMPQVLFLGMYQNNDSLSLFSVSMMLYFLVKGEQNHWDVKNCIWLAVGISICALSYYSVYPWILFSILYCCLSCYKDKEILNKLGFILKRAVLVFVVFCLLAGWFFIRNAILNNGDFLGLYTKKLMKENAISNGIVLPNIVKYDLGYSFWSFFKERNFHWLKYTVASFIGAFGNMDIPMPYGRYAIYCLILLSGIIGYLTLSCLKKNNFAMRRLTALMFFSSLAVFALSLYNSFFTDYQPQGRYVISAILLFAYMLAYVLDNIKLPGNETDKKYLYISGSISTGWIILAFITILDTMSKMLDV